MEILLSADAWLFFLLNKTIANPLFDGIVVLLTKKYLIFSVAMLAWVSAFWHGKTRTRRLLLLSLAAFVLSDITVVLLKDWFMRVRPCHMLNGVRLIAECSDSFSLPSRHSTDVFGVMVFLGIGFKKYLPLFIAIAFVMAVSRVYAGVHYPGDVFTGAIIGTLAALMVHYLNTRYGFARPPEV